MAATSLGCVSGAIQVAGGLAQTEGVVGVRAAETLREENKENVLAGKYYEKCAKLPGAAAGDVSTGRLWASLKTHPKDDPMICTYPLTIWKG